MGISEAFYIPAALALIADHHTGHTRSQAIGFHQTAIYCGVIVGGFAGYAADSPDIGWRSTFDITGLVGIAYAIPLLFLLREAPRANVSIEPRTKIPSIALGLVYMAVFGMGSIGGMLIMSAVISVPFVLTARRFEAINGVIRLCAGVFSLAFGLMIGSAVFFYPLSISPAHLSQTGLIADPHRVAK